MKVVKLILAFIVVLGCVVGAFFLINGKGGSVLLPPPPDDIYQTYRKQFEQDWKDKGDWDEQLFSEHCDKVRILSKEYDAAPLNDLNTTTAVEIVSDKIFNEWASASCRKSTIEHYINALGKIQAEDSNAKNNPNVKKILDVYQTYKEAYSLAHTNVGLSPHFNGSSWNSFANYENGLNNKKRAMESDANYRTHLSNIKELKDGISALPSKLERAKSSFYSNLANEIVSYYRKKYEPSLRTREQLVELRSIRDKYNQEWPSKNQGLQSFCKEFGDDVDDNEEVNRTNGYRSY